MTADTITPNALENIARYLEISAGHVRKIRDSAESGDVSPDAAATDLRCIMQFINAISDFQP
jgi:hypothetical protein